jgi:hypothetical protein
MTTPSVDNLASVLRGPAEKELDELLGELRFDDLTTCEMLAFVAILRPAWERRQARQNPPAPLKLVRPGKH